MENLVKTNVYICNNGYKQLLIALHKKGKLGRYSLSCIKALTEQSAKNIIKNLKLK